MDAVKFSPWIFSYMLEIQNLQVCFEAKIYMNETSFKVCLRAKQIIDFFLKGQQRQIQESNK